MMPRLITRPHIEHNGSHIDRFEAWLGGEESTELLVISRQPRLDAARELLSRGYDPDTLLTTRAWNRDYDSWRPEPIGELAKWIIVDTNRDGLRRERWKPLYNAGSAPAGTRHVRESGSGAGSVPPDKDGAVASRRTPANGIPEISPGNSDE